MGWSVQGRSGYLRGAAGPARDNAELARLYAARGVSSAQELETGLGALHTPASMRGLERAAARLADAFEREEPILVIGDYDADGATSTALSSPRATIGSP